MPRNLALPPPGFKELTVEEQIDYVQALWDAIAARPELVPLPDWHRQVLEERLAEYENDPDEGVAWEDFRSELLSDDPSLRR